MNELIVMTKEQLRLIIREELEALSRNPIERESLAEEEYVTFKEALLMLKISRPTLFKHMKDGTISYRKVGKRLLFPKRRIMKDLEERSIATKNRYKIN